MYSFNQSRLKKWRVNTKVVEVQCGGQQTFKYHLASLPNSVMTDIRESLGKYYPVNGMLYQWWLIADKPEDADHNALMDTSYIYMLDNTECLEPYFAIEDLLANNVGVLRRGSNDKMGEEFNQAIPDRVTFAMTPVIGGIPYNTGLLSNGHFAAVFANPSDTPIEFEVYLRHQIFVQNN